MNDTLDTSALSGRDLARARRREMSRTGGANIKSGGSSSRTSSTRPARIKPSVAPPVASIAETSVKPSVESSPAQSSVAPQVAPQSTPMAPIESTGSGTKPLSGKALSMARRAMLARGGKSALPAKAKVSQGRKKPDATASNVAASSPVEARVAPVAEKSEACCDACADADADASATPALQSNRDDTAIDSLCSIIESSSDASSSVRAFCRDRRTTLSKKGKLGLSGKAGMQARKSLMRNASTSPLTGKAMAKLRREDRNEVGRGDKPKSRPSGRVRPDAGEAPPKVEVGTTLSGQEVTGTSVEQSEKLTGVESGACRIVTGTEYLGVEQFENLCNSTPQPAAPKVGLSETGGGQLLTGSKTVANNKVTGDESGSCKSVTGSEYLGAEHFGAFCSASAMNKAKEKVVVGSTAKNLPISGVDEARDSAVTGSETGVNQRVTGSEYSNIAPDFSKMNAKKSQAPAKVDVSHTAAGVAVSGGESRISGVTGDDQDVCRLVTGSEYISSERIQTACGTSPQRSVAKVGEDVSRAGMSITGNLFDRTQNVTGNEPGTCQRVTGSQYGDSAQLGACDSRSSKVHEMHTLQGRRLTGTEGSPSPKLSGDDRGSCSAVTGSEYVSQEFFKQSCTQTPQPSTIMSSVGRTWNDQVVSGVQTGHSQKTTGDEQGLCNTVTGSDYAGREQVAEFCSTAAVAQGEQRLRQPNNAPVIPVSGATPAIDQRLSGSFQRGQCQDVTGSRYQGQEDVMLCNMGNRHHLAQAPISQELGNQKLGNQASRGRSAIVVDNTAEPYQADFSILSPAKSAWQQRKNDPVHSSVYARRSSITGPANKAEGMISGTPDFRHERDIQPNKNPVTAPMGEVELGVEKQRAERITGEGSESGTAITGDDWSRGGLVTGTEGLFSSRRNQTQQGASVKRNNIGAHALKERERPEASTSRVTGGSGTNESTSTTGLVTLSGGATA